MPRTPLVIMAESHSAIKTLSTKSLSREGYEKESRDERKRHTGKKCSKHFEETATQAKQN